MKIVKKSMKVAKNFNVWEIGFFKIYLIVVALILSILFPVILTASLGLYIVIFILFIIVLLYIFIKQQGNYLKTILKKGFGVKLFEKMNMFDFSLFKSTMFLAGLILAKLFPVLLTFHIGYYIAIACLFIGYYFGKLFSK